MPRTELLRQQARARRAQLDLAGGRNAVSRERRDGLLHTMSAPGGDFSGALALLTAFAEHTALTVDAERSFGELGRVLLAAVGRAAQEGSTLAAALDRASARPAEPDDLGELAGLVAQLAEQGEQERRLALALVREVVTYTGRRSPRRSR